MTSPETTFYQDVDSLGEKVQNIPEPQKQVILISELPVGKDLTALITGFKIKDSVILKKYSGQIDGTSNFRQIDQVIFTITKDQEIKDTEKAAFLKKLRVFANEQLSVRLAKSTGQDFSIDPSAEQPVTSSYLVSAERAKQYFESLRTIRKEVKEAAHGLIYSGLTQYEQVPLEGIPEDVKRIVLSRMKSFNPSTKEESTVEDLKKHFNGTPLDTEGEILSKLQYLRILKEKVNFLIASQNESAVLLSEQEKSQELTPLRLGDRTTIEKNARTRRHSVLANIHYGETMVEPKGESQGRNIIGIDPEISKLIDQLKNSIKDGKESQKILEELPENTKTHLSWLKEKGGVLVTAEDEKDITKRFLSELGVLSNETDSAQQVSDFEAKRPSQGIKTLAVAVLDTIINNMIEPKNNLIAIPNHKEGIRLDTSLITRLHELTHALQKLRRDKSPFELMRRLDGLGRQTVLSEMGAMHNENLIQGLLSKRTNYWSTYELDIFDGYLNGETFTDLIQRAIKPIYENDEEVKNIPEDQVMEYETIRNGVIVKESVNKKMATACEVAMRRVMRLYKDLGATGDGRNSPVRKYPNTWSMAYILGELPKYTQYSSTLSGVPTHRIEELKDLLPDFYINDEKVTDSMIIRIFIDSAYEVMKAKLEPPATSI